MRFEWRRDTPDDAAWVRVGGDALVPEEHLPHLRDAAQRGVAAVCALGVRVRGLPTVELALDEADTFADDDDFNGVVRRARADGVVPIHLAVPRACTWTDADVVRLATMVCHEVIHVTLAEAVHAAWSDGNLCLRHPTLEWVVRGLEWSVCRPGAALPALKRTAACWATAPLDRQDFCTHWADPTTVCEPPLPKDWADQLEPAFGAYVLRLLRLQADEVGVGMGDMLAWLVDALVEHEDPDPWALFGGKLHLGLARLDALQTRPELHPLQLLALHALHAQTYDRVGWPAAAGPVWARTRPCTLLVPREPRTEPAQVVRRALDRFAQGLPACPSHWGEALTLLVEAAAHATPDAEARVAWARIVAQVFDDPCPARPWWHLPKGACRATVLLRDADARGLEAWQAAADAVLERLCVLMDGDAHRFAPAVHRSRPGQPPPRGPLVLVWAAPLTIDRLLEARRFARRHPVHVALFTGVDGRPHDALPADEEGTLDPRYREELWEYAVDTPAGSWADRVAAGTLANAVRTPLAWLCATLRLGMADQIVGPPAE